MRRPAGTAASINAMIIARVGSVTLSASPQITWWAALHALQRTENLGMWGVQFREQPIPSH